MIRMRDDDVLVRSGSFSSPLARFQQMHEWICLCPQMIHVPTLIVEDLQEFPECVEYIRQETAAGRMLPEFHCMFHVPYSDLSVEHVTEHLVEGIEWMEENIGRTPEFWYTPWGSDQDWLKAAAGECGLTLVGVDKHWVVNRVTARLAAGEPVESLQGKEIMFHWWEGGCRIARLALAVNCGGWEEASKAHREFFRA